MYNELNNISRAVNGQALEMKKTQQQQKQAEYIKSELRSMLQSELMDLNDIFDDDTKATAIESVLNNTIVLLYSKDYTRQFLNDKYYTIARQVEQIKKKTAPKNQDDYKKQIAIEKRDIQRQKELLKIKLLEQKIAQNEQKYNIKQSQKQIYVKRSGNGSEVAKVLLYLMFAPIAIFGLIIYGFISAAAKTK
jgi:hypothetical protein